MLVRFIHPATSLETEADLPVFCPRCVKPVEPSEAEQQANVGDSVEVHCACGDIALKWSPPSPIPEPPSEPEPEG